MRMKFSNLTPLTLALLAVGYGTSAVSATSTETNIESQEAWDSLIQQGSDLSEHSITIEAGTSDTPLTIDEDFTLIHTGDLTDAGTAGPFLIQGSSVVDFTGSTLSIQSHGNSSATGGALAVKGSSVVNVGSADHYYDSITLTTEGAPSALYVDVDEESQVGVFANNIDLNVNVSDASAVWVKGGDLQIHSGSPIEINVNEASQGNNFGIRHDDGTTSMSGDVDIHFAGESGYGSYGIRAQAGTLTLQDVTVTAEGPLSVALANAKANLFGSGGTVEILGDLRIDLQQGGVIGGSASSTSAVLNDGSKATTTVRGNTDITVNGIGTGIYAPSGSVSLFGETVDIATQSGNAVITGSTGKVYVDTGSVNITSESGNAVQTSGTVDIAADGEVVLTSREASGVNTSNKGAVGIAGDTIRIEGVIGIEAGLSNNQKSTVSLTGNTVNITGRSTDGEPSLGMKISAASVVTINASDTTVNGDVTLSNTGKLIASGLNGTVGTTTLNGNVSAVEGTEVSLTNQRIELLGNFTVDTLTGADTDLLVHDFDNTLSIAHNQIDGLGLVVSGELNDQYADASQALDALREAADITNEDGASTAMSGEAGTVSGDWTYDPATGVVTQHENVSLAALADFNAMTLALWRNQNNHLFDRLGSVRSDRGQIGVWARVYGNDGSIDKDVSIDLKSNSVQVGADVAVGSNWIVGGAFSYTDAEGDFSNGEGKTDMYSLATYATGMFDCGGYIDIVGRVGRLSSNVTASTLSTTGGVLKGSYDNTAFGLSAEIGYKWDVTSIFYVEPQMELAYGFVSGDDFRSSNGVKYEQDDFQTLVGRIGTRLGANLPEQAGTIFLHASLLHDFLGDADSTATPRQGLARDVSVDIGGTWFAYGIGAQFDMKKNVSFYGMLERSSGSDYQDDYRYSVGFSYRF